MPSIYEAAQNDMHSHHHRVCLDIAFGMSCQRQTQHVDHIRTRFTSMCEYENNPITISQSQLHPAADR